MRTRQQQQQQQWKYQRSQLKNLYYYWPKNEVVVVRASCIEIKFYDIMVLRMPSICIKLKSLS